MSLRYTRNAFVCVCARIFIYVYVYARVMYRDFLPFQRSRKVLEEIASARLATLGEEEPTVIGITFKYAEYASICDNVCFTAG